MLDRFRASLGTLVAQLFFIAAGVYLGNQADDWKQQREHRRAARAALENFRTELAANRDELRRRAAIYQAYADSMRVSQRRGDAAPKSVREALERLDWRGTSPVAFNHTAWDLALGTQALSYLPPPLAFRIARLYTAQERMQTMQRGTGDALFTPASMDDGHIFAWLLSFGGYVGDSILASRQIAGEYDRTLPALDSAVASLPR